MSTTTLRLPDEVKARIDKLARASGKTAHAFMVETLADATDAMERRRAFEAEADERWAEYRRTGEHLALEDLRTHARALIAAEPVPGGRPASIAPRRARARTR